ncbi:MAG: NDP-sugar synthase [bacterium]
MAAGLGTRLYPITRKTLKAMLPVVNKPAIGRIIENLKAHNITDIIINIYQNGEQIKEYLGTGGKFGVKIAYSEEETLLGTAGSVKKASWFFDPDTTIILSGDGVSNLNLTEFIEFHQGRKSFATINLSFVSDPLHYGVVVVERDGRIKEFQEKPRPKEAISNLANTGIYAFERKIFDLIPDGEYDFGKQLFPEILKENVPFYGYYSEAYWNDMGTIDVYRQVHMDILMKRVSLPIAGKETRPGITVGTNTYIDEDAELIPPIAIGNNVVIEKYARLKGPLSINDSCRIEESCNIERSIILPKTTIGKNTKIRDGIIAEGSKIANNVVLVDNNVIGSYATIGEYSILHPGIKVDSEIEVPSKTELKENIMRD